MHTTTTITRKMKISYAISHVVLFNISDNIRISQSVSDKDNCIVQIFMWHVCRLTLTVNIFNIHLSKCNNIAPQTDTVT